MVPNLSEKDEDALRGIVKYCDSATAHIEQFGNTFEIFCNNLAFQEACSFDAIQIGEVANKLILYDIVRPDMSKEAEQVVHKALVAAYKDQEDLLRRACSLH